jgi:hypothetical protein
MNVSWKNTPKTLYFNDLSDGDSFRIATGNSKGAIYTRVNLNPFVMTHHYNDTLRGRDYGMLEIATGKVFIPTKSPVERVSVNVSIDTEKPSLYD